MAFDKSYLWGLCLKLGILKTEAITFDQLVSGVLLYQGNTNTQMFNDVCKEIYSVKLLDKIIEACDRNEETRPRS